MSDLNKLTCDQLKNILRARGLKVSGKKAELIERINEYNQQSTTSLESTTSSESTESTESKTFGIIKSGRTTINFEIVNKKITNATYHHEPTYSWNETRPEIEELPQVIVENGYMTGSFLSNLVNFFSVYIFPTNEKHECLFKDYTITLKKGDVEKTTTIPEISASFAHINFKVSKKMSGISIEDNTTEDELKKKLKLFEKIKKMFLAIPFSTQKTLQKTQKRKSYRYNILTFKQLYDIVCKKEMQFKWNGFTCPLLQDDSSCSLYIDYKGSLITFRWCSLFD